MTHNASQRQVISLDSRVAIRSPTRDFQFQHPMYNVSGVVVKSVTIPNALLTIRTGYNDTFGIRFYVKNGGTTYDSDVLTCTIPEGLYYLTDTPVEMSFTKAVGNAILAALKAWVETAGDPVFTINGDILNHETRVEVTASGITPMTIRIGIREDNNFYLHKFELIQLKQMDFRYFGFPYYDDDGKFTSTTVNVLNHGPNTGPLDPAKCPMLRTSAACDLTRTHYISIASDLGVNTYHSRVDTYRKTLVTVPMSSVPVGGVATHQFGETDIHIDFGQRLSIRSMTFEVYDEEGRDITNEFVTFPILLDLYFIR